jgi:hypothetical protein
VIDTAHDAASAPEATTVTLAPHSLVLLRHG